MHVTTTTYIFVSPINTMICEYKNAFLVQLNALDYVNKHRLFDIVISKPQYNLIDPAQKSSSNARTQKVYIPSKKKAIFNIAQENNKPLPYLLFGPAGKWHNSPFAMISKWLWITIDEWYFGYILKKQICNVSNLATYPYIMYS